MELRLHKRWTTSAGPPIAALIRGALAPAKTLPPAAPRPSQRTLYLLLTALAVLATTPLFVGWIAGQLLR